MAGAEGAAALVVVAAGDELPEPLSELPQAANAREPAATSANHPSPPWPRPRRPPGLLPDGLAKKITEKAGVDRLTAFLARDDHIHARIDEAGRCQRCLHVGREVTKSPGRR